MKNRLMPMLIAAILLLICFMPLLFMQSGQTEAYEVVVFGDSNMAGIFSHESVAVQLESLSGMRVLTGAFGGTTMADTNVNGDAGNHYSFLTMARLSECVAERDFSLAYMSSLKGTYFEIPHYPYYIKNLSSVDWDSVKYIIISHGANDYSAAVPVDNQDDPYDIHSFGGALRTSVQNLRDSVPGATIILLTPTYNRVAEDGDCLTYDFGGGLLEDYVSKEIEIAKEMDICLVDNFNESGIGPDNYDKYLVDGLHLNDEASTILAELLYEYILSLDGE